MGNSASTNGLGSGGRGGKEHQKDNESSCAPFLCTSILRDPMPKIPSEMKNDFYTLGFIKEDHVPVPYYWPVIQVDPRDTPTYIRNNWLHDAYQLHTQGEKNLNMKRIVYRYSIDDFILIEADEIISYNQGIEQGLDLLPRDVVHKLRTGKPLTILDLNLILSRESLRVEARKLWKDRNVWKHANENINNEIDVSQESLSGSVDDEESRKKNSSDPRKSRELKRKRNHQPIGGCNDCGDDEFEDAQEHDTAHFIVTPEHTKKKKRKEPCKARLHDMNLQEDRRVLDFSGESNDVVNMARLNETAISNAVDSKGKNDHSNSSIIANEDDELDEHDFGANSIDLYDKVNNGINVGANKEADDATTSIGEHKQGNNTNDDFKNPQESFIGKRQFKRKKEKDSIFLDNSDSDSDSDSSDEELSDSESIAKDKRFSISKSLDRIEIFQKDLNIYLQEDRAKLEQEIMSNLSTRIKDGIHEVCFAREEGKLYPVFVLSPFDLFPCESQSSYFTKYRQSGNNIVLVFWYGYGQDEKTRIVSTIYESELVHYSEGIEEFEETLDACETEVREGIQYAKEDKTLPREKRLQWLLEAETAKYRFLEKMLKQDPLTVKKYRSIGVIKFKGKSCPALQICPLDVPGEIRKLFIQSLLPKEQKKRKIFVLLYGEKSGAKNKFTIVEPHQFTPIEKVPKPYPDERLVLSKGGIANLSSDEKEYYLRWRHMRHDLHRSRIERPLSYSLMKEMQK